MIIACTRAYISRFTFFLIILLSQSPAHAIFWYDIVGAVKSIYPFNMIVRSIDYITKSHSHRSSAPVDNTFIQLLYPHAYSYLQHECKKNGIRIENIQLKNTDTTDSSSVSHNLMILPIELLERGLATEFSSPILSRQLNIAKMAIAHELGHLKHHSLCLCHLYASIVAIGATAAVSRNWPRMPTLSKTLLESVCSHFIVNIIDHIDEYRSDSSVIKQFKDKPHVLIDAASFFLSSHQAAQAFLNSVSMRGKLYSTQGKFYSTHIGSTLTHWLFTPHPSFIVRTNRFLRAAGVPSQPHILCREMRQQFNERLRRSWYTKCKDWLLEKNDVDMQRIIAACQEFDKNISAVHLPEPFETYGQ